MGGGQVEDPEFAGGRTIVIVDIDYISPWKAEALWVRQCLLRGDHCVLLDAYRDYCMKSPTEPVRELESARKAIGCAVGISRQVDPAHMTPRSERGSTKYCLVDLSREHLVLQPDKGPFTVSLPESQNSYTMAWLDLLTGTTQPGEQIEAGGAVRLSSPFDGPSAALLRAVGKAKP